MNGRMARESWIEYVESGISSSSSWMALEQEMLVDSE